MKCVNCGQEIEQGRYNEDTNFPLVWRTLRPDYSALCISTNSKHEPEPTEAAPSLTTFEKRSGIRFKREAVVGGQPQTPRPAASGTESAPVAEDEIDNLKRLCNSLDEIIEEHDLSDGATDAVETCMCNLGQIIERMESQPSSLTQAGPQHDAKDKRIAEQRKQLKRLTTILEATQETLLAFLARDPEKLSLLVKDTHLIEHVVVEAITSIDKRCRELEKQLADLKLKAYQRRQEPLDYL